MIKNAKMFGARQMLEKLRVGEKLNAFDYAQIAEFGCYMSPPSFFGKLKGSEELARAISPAVEKYDERAERLIREAVLTQDKKPWHNPQWIIDARCNTIVQHEGESLYFRELQACDDILYNQPLFAYAAGFSENEPKEFAELAKLSLLRNGLGELGVLEEMKYQAASMFTQGAPRQKSDALTAHRAIVRDRADRPQAA